MHSEHFDVAALGAVSEAEAMVWGRFVSGSRYSKKDQEQVQYFLRQHLGQIRRSAFLFHHLGRILSMAMGKGL